MKWKRKESGKLVAKDKFGRLYSIYKNKRMWILKRDGTVIDEGTKVDLMDDAELLGLQEPEPVLSPKQYKKAEAVFRRAAREYGFPWYDTIQFPSLWKEAFGYLRPNKVPASFYREMDKKHRSIYEPIRKAGKHVQWFGMKLPDLEHLREEAKGPECTCKWRKKYLPGQDEGWYKATCPMCKPEEIIEEPPKEIPPRPVPNGFLKITAPAGKCPYRLENAKWKTLEEWVEKAREWYEDVTGNFLTLQGLMHWINLGYDKDGNDRTRKACRRIAAMCQEEWNQEVNRAHALQILSTRKKEEPTEESEVIVVLEGNHASGRRKTKKKPGVVSRIVELLKKASKKRPLTREDILEDLKEKFPDRNPKAMRNTIGSQIPAGLRSEKGLEVKQNKKGYWLE